jgi:glycosyltransferase involved in cell wall biosynthesis
MNSNAETAPLISVVMPVYNGAGHLPTTLESVLGQRGVAFELVAVDDGSTDAGAQILAEYQRRDARIRVLHHERNEGLTAALITGCSAASGRFIARQDVGDTSLAGRLEAQASVLRDHPDVVLTACGTRYVSPEGIELFESAPHSEEVDSSLRSLDPRQLQGPSHHGATMFRKSVYDQVGGYRRPFRVAQDLDLWTRLIERGRFLATDGVLYQGGIYPSSISGLHRACQQAMTRLIARAGELRRRGESEEPVLQQAADLSRRRPGWRRLREAQAHYFVGSCLQEKNSEVARSYFRSALRSFPLHGKAWFRWLAG